MHVIEVEERSKLTQISFRRKYPMASTVFDRGDVPANNREQVMRTMLTEPKTVKVLIVSANPFVMDFLKGLVEIHGYHTEKETDFHEALIRVHDGLADVVFIDDGCLDVENSKTFQLRTQELIQEGAPIILLTNEQLKQDLEQQLPRSFFRIVRKPVGYLQIGQVMADLMTV